MVALRTIGISPKAVLAFLFPFIATLVATAATWITTGEFDEDAIRIGLSGLLASGIALLGAYVGNPGNVEPQGTTFQKEMT